MKDPMGHNFTDDEIKQLTESLRVALGFDGSSFRTDRLESVVGLFAWVLRDYTMAIILDAILVYNWFKKDPIMPCYLVSILEDPYLMAHQYQSERGYVN